MLEKYLQRKHVVKYKPDIISDDKIKRRGYNKLYMNEVTQADEGVDFQFLK